MVVQWRYEPANDSGLPSSSVTEQMSALEQLLDPALEGPRAAFNTVVVTGGGVREWQWYTRNPEEFMRLVNTGLSGHTPFPVSFNVQGQDPSWSAYSGFSGSAT